MPIRLALGDDPSLILQGLELLLRQEPAVQVLACGRNGEDIQPVVHQLQHEKRLSKTTGGRSYACSPDSFEGGSAHIRREDPPISGVIEKCIAR